MKFKVGDVLQDNYGDYCLVKGVNDEYYYIDWLTMGNDCDMLASENFNYGHSYIERCYDYMDHVDLCGYNDTRVCYDR